MVVSQSHFTKKCRSLRARHLVCRMGFYQNVAHSGLWISQILECNSPTFNGRAIAFWRKARDEQGGNEFQINRDALRAVCLVYAFNLVPILTPVRVQGL